MANEAGAGCTSRGSSIGAYTFVSQGAPASLAGSCNKLQAYVNAATEDATAQFAFFTAAGNDLTTVAGTRTNVTIAQGIASCRTYDAPGDFTAFSVSSGNYLGFYTSKVSYYSLSGGSGIWYKSGDQTNISGITFSNGASGIDSLSADIIAAGGVENSQWYYQMLRRRN